MTRSGALPRPGLHAIQTRNGPPSPTVPDGGSVLWHRMVGGSNRHGERCRAIVRTGAAGARGSSPPFYSWSNRLCSKERSVIPDGRCGGRAGTRDFYFATRYLKRLGPGSPPEGFGRDEATTGAKRDAPIRRAPRMLARGYFCNLGGPRSEPPRPPLTRPSARWPAQTHFTRSPWLLVALFLRPPPIGWKVTSRACSSSL